MFKSLKSQLLASSLAAIALIILAVVFIFIGHLGWAALILGISCLIIIVLNIWFSRCVCDPIAEHTVFAKRIAEGSGTSIQEVNRLLKQFEGTRKVMKMVATGGGRQLMQNMKNNLR